MDTKAICSYTMVFLEKAYCSLSFFFFFLHLFRGVTLCRIHLYIHSVCERLCKISYTREVKSTVMQVVN